MRTSLEEHQKRKELYDQGLSDIEIADLCFVCINAIRYWRKNHNPPLPVNAKQAIQESTRLALYKANLTDREIAREEKVSKMAIRGWRKKHNLPENRPWEDG